MTRPNLEVVIPYAGQCPHRERALDWVTNRLGSYVLAEGGDPWVKAMAVMPAVERSSADVIVMHDADVWCDGLPAAIDAVLNGAPWAVPHDFLHRLSQAGTEAVLRGESWEDQELDQDPYIGLHGGGIVVVRREVFLDVPLDPRFVGWGTEDEVWGLALWTMQGGPWQGKAPLVHLWHPPQERLTRKVGSLESQQIGRLYHRARLDPPAMQIVLDQAKERLQEAKDLSPAT